VDETCAHLSAIVHSVPGGVGAGGGVGERGGGYGWGTGVGVHPLTACGPVLMHPELRPACAVYSHTPSCNSSVCTTR
jgi:hypothetical protein